ncbi:diversity-generating retroelement protein Avd [Lacrimispora indolis]|uniref:diversity-generating retroelement protein Avd n=1 Tax=Lacrimispora indolis TaxID=69825 RepID=UPI000462511E|nr:diversity-generating retroelement protein Avd [[Clostridium] methoxybenzovorans]
MGTQRNYYHKPKGNPETDEGTDQRSGLIILQKTKDLMQYLYISFVKYPRSEKLGFVADYKKCLFSFLGYIITAQKKYYKKTTLQDADVQLELLRLFNDLSYDMKFIDEKRYKLISDRLCEIGRLLGGWIKSQKETSKDGK